MEERLKEIKKMITSFVNDYQVDGFYVEIEEFAEDLAIGKQYFNAKIEIRV